MEVAGYIRGNWSGWSDGVDARVERGRMDGQQREK
jgi:hypothetical protein